MRWITDSEAEMRSNLSWSNDVSNDFLFVSRRTCFSLQYLANRPDTSFYSHDVPCVAVRPQFLHFHFMENQAIVNQVQQAFCGATSTELFVPVVHSWWSYQNWVKISDNGVLNSGVGEDFIFIISSCMRCASCRCCSIAKRIRARCNTILRANHKYTSYNCHVQGMLLGVFQKGRMVASTGRFIPFHWQLSPWMYNVGSRVGIGCTPYFPIGSKPLY